MYSILLAYLQNLKSCVLVNSFPPRHFHGFLACCSFFFPSSVRPELLKSVVIPSMTVNLGLRLSTAQSHITCFPLSSRRSPRLFLRFHARSARQSTELSSSHPKSHLACPRGKFEMMNTKKSRVCLRLLHIIHLNLNSGQGTLHRG